MLKLKILAFQLQENYLLVIVINIKYYDTNQSYKKQNPFASTKDLSCLDSVTLSSPNLNFSKISSFFVFVWGGGGKCGTHTQSQRQRQRTIPEGDHIYVSQIIQDTGLAKLIIPKARSQMTKYQLPVTK